MVKIFEHEHPLKLIDLLEKHEESDEDEEEDDLVTQEFLCICERCGEEINEYHRYYYKCIIDDPCVYNLHKFCAELPVTLANTSHPHPVTLRQFKFSLACSYCFRTHRHPNICYGCSTCLFTVHVKCVVEEDIRRIYHPSHRHPLVSLLSRHISCECDACGMEHKGVFFQCTTCLDFAIHTDCIKLPKCLLIQTTNDIFRHTHPLTLSYSFPMKEQQDKYNPKCRVCDGYFRDRHWIYKCEKCIYYTHVDCAMSRREPFMSIVYKGKVTPTIKNFVDADYPHLLRLPFPDQTHSIQKHLFSKETRPTIDEVSPKLINHQHDLVLVDANCIDSLGGSTSSKINSLILCHNPMKKIQLLCNACLRPIMEIPFYKCGENGDESCNFAIHEWCTRLPSKVNNHPGHPQHTLVLMPHAPHVFFNIFLCDACGLPCNGYAYVCLKCKYYVDVSCAFIPEHITHTAHPCHLLSRVKEIPIEFKCLVCLLPVSMDGFKAYGYSEKLMGFGCSVCDVYIHVACAMLLPETIRHVCDKHPMRLSYLPIENHKSKYFCEICEIELIPNYCFYHCDECAQSGHTSCAPLILNYETHTYSLFSRNVYMHLNVKFGGTHKTDSHPHPLTLSQGIAADDQYYTYGTQLQYRMLLKCTECEFVVDYRSGKKDNHS